jgi:hypothetical protein
MKTFQPIVFDPQRCRTEVAQLRSWLARRPVLLERKHIQPFFRQRRHLSAFLGSYNPDLIDFDRLAFEYPLFGDFSCDIAVGDSVNHAYCFIELEDAGPASLFVKQGRKATREWSPRFEHGFSQIIDWLHKLDDMRRSDDFVTRFGARVIQYSAILIVGRDHHLGLGERERLEWRSDNVIVASQSIRCVTFDAVAKSLEGRLGRLNQKARTDS